jgi:glutamate 5-kinase
VGEYAYAHDQASNERMRFDPEHIHSLVIKIGTSLVSGTRAFEGKVMESLVREICHLKAQYDWNIVIVTSGAVGCGMKKLGLAERPQDLPIKQAVAAVGQAELMHYYETLFAHYSEGRLVTAQILLTRNDLDSRQVYLNVRNTFETLFAMRRVVPIVNENDTTATEELRFGDNDTLSARITSKLGADLLILLTDVDGFFDRHPSHPEAKLIPYIESITPEIVQAAGGAGSIVGTGGMQTKLEAARIATVSGAAVVIANGHRNDILQGVLSGDAPCTLFAPRRRSLSQRRRWIAFGKQSQGIIRIDDGAKNALLVRGKSLLPAGILDVVGDFPSGAAVTIVDAAGERIGHALVNFSSEEIRAILGKHSHDIETILGRACHPEVVHRDNLVLL